MQNEPPVQKRLGANLPHWTREGATYFITFRTADSLPAEAIEKLSAESRLLERKQNWQKLEPEETLRLSRLKSDGYLKLLDQSYGACILLRDDCAEVVAKALKHYAEVHYRLWAWCVMPNHVHTVVQPFQGFELPKMLHGWKSVSSKRIGKLLGQGGVFWQSESYDHIIRDEAEFDHYMAYTLNNPKAAGLTNWKWLGKFPD